MSNIDLVLLGLIKQKSQSAYDIKKNIEYRNIPRWVKISEQSIYKKVLQLESKNILLVIKGKREICQIKQYILLPTKVMIILID